MSRYTGPTWKVSRRLNYSISETGVELKKRPYAPGQHGKHRAKMSEYGVQLQEKQRVRFTYGVSEKQFKKVFDLSAKMPGKRGDNFLVLLETRLDNLVYRLGFAKTRKQARQLVAHGHITVNDKKLDIPSYLVKPGQTISLKESSRSLVVVKDALSYTNNLKDYLTFNEDTLTGTLVRMPERNEFLQDIQENLIVEFYNR